MSRCTLLSFSTGVALVLFVACGEPPPAVTPPPAPAPAPAPAPEPTGTSDAAPADTAAADAGAPKQQGSGRPPIIKTDSVEITDTFGSTPAARLEIGGDKELATFRIPEGALAGATNVTFKLDPKGKNNGGLIGKLYRVTMIIPPAPAPTVISSGGPPFQLQLPAGGKKDANLAMGEITKDDKGKDKVVWTVVAPVKIDDASGVAHFEVTALGDTWLHVTSKAASGGGAAK